MRSLEMETREFTHSDVYLYISAYINTLTGSSRITYGEPGLDINEPPPAGMVMAAIFKVSLSSTEAPVKHTR